MRILYSFPDGLGRPGIGTTAYHQIQGAVEHGVDVIVFCTSMHRHIEGVERVVTTLSYGGRRIPHRAMGIERSYRYHDRRVALALRRMHRNVDLVHCWPRATVHTMAAAHRYSIPGVREVPNTHTAHAFAEVQREIELLAMRRLPAYSHTFSEQVLEREEEEYASADALLVPSEFSRRTFLERGFEPDKLVLHRYGFDPTVFYPRSDAEKSLSDAPLRAIFVGRCEPRKGLHYALRAWIDSGAANRGRFVICGAFVPGYREVLSDLLAHPSVEVRGFVDDPAALMRESDVLVFPSIEEGSALASYEARACGCVLVVSEATGARCRHEVDALVHAPRDVETLTLHVRRLDQDRGLLKRLRAASISTVSDLRWSAAGAELASLYRRCATEKLI